MEVPRQVFSRHSALSVDCFKSSRSDAWQEYHLAVAQVRTMKQSVDTQWRHFQGKPWSITELPCRHMELKFHTNLKVGCVFTCFYCPGLVKVLFCVLRSNSLRYTGYFGPNFFEVSLGHKKGVWWCQCLHRVSAMVGGGIGASIFFFIYCRGLLPYSQYKDNHNRPNPTEEFKFDPWDFQ